jgi:hypothetical protein
MAKLLQIPLPEGIRDKLIKLAEIDRRSMTSEALVILEKEIGIRFEELSESSEDATA